MTFDALATDYDGTLAHDGIVDPATVEALQRAREAGLKVLMVTGRELTDLFNTFAHPTLFDAIVAENGAVIYHPATETADVLAPAPPPAFIERLTDAHIPLSVGHSIVATVAPHEHTVLAAIRELQMEWHVIFNKGSVMALPADVTKASGLAAALSAVGVAANRTVGIGDAENDLAFLRASGFAVAVANALPTVKEEADLVTAGARGAGVVEVIDALLRGELVASPEPHTGSRL
jgi:hydroxymethylpyrimidine pyrophosphatase-like HAD family hydrolase